MGYDYTKERAEVFTEHGSAMLLKIHDKINNCIKISGAVTIEMAISGNTGSSWTMMACVDRLVELGKIRIVKTGGATQHNVILPIN